MQGEDEIDWVALAARMLRDPVTGIVPEQKIRFNNVTSNQVNVVFIHNSVFLTLCSENT
jgi:hypothetical protein